MEAPFDRCEMTNIIAVLPKNRIIIRPPANSVNGTWYMVTVEWLDEQRRFSKNPTFEKAYQLAKEEYEKN